MTTEQLRKDEIHVAQSEGGHYSRRVRLEAGARRVADAMLKIVKTGVVPDPKAVTMLTGLDPRTVNNHWQAAIALNAANMIMAQVLNHPTIVEEPGNKAHNTSSPEPAKCSSRRGGSGRGPPQREEPGERRYGRKQR